MVLAIHLQMLHRLHYAARTLQLKASLSLGDALDVSCRDTDAASSVDAGAHWQDRTSAQQSMRNTMTDHPKDSSEDIVVK